jgi:hypothetical protein
MMAQTDTNGDTRGERAGRDEWGEVCRQAEEMVGGEGEYTERAYKATIAELLGGLKALRNLTNTTITRTVNTAISRLPNTSAQPNQKAFTYAGVANRPPPPTPQRTTVKVYITDPEEQKELAGLTGKEIVTRIGKQEIVGAKADRQGVLKLFTAQEQDRKKLETQKEWTVKIGRTAKVSHQQYMVIAHGMTREFDQTKDVPELQKQNQIQAPGVQITKAAWVNRRVEATKRQSSLILWVGSAEQANQILDKGLFWNFEKMDTEIHQSTHRILQCFKCQQYGHIAPKCTAKSDTCSHCAGSHAARECHARKEDTRCACCGKRHTSWSSQCTARIQAQMKAREARMNTPARFPTQTQEAGLRLSEIAIPKKRRTAEGGQPALQDTHPPLGRPSFTFLARKDPSQTKITTSLRSSQTAIEEEGDTSDLIEQRDTPMESVC